MSESKKTYKLDCDIPTGILIGESFTFLTYNLNLEVALKIVTTF